MARFIVSVVSVVYETLAPFMAAGFGLLCAALAWAFVPFFVWAVGKIVHWF